MFNQIRVFGTALVTAFFLIITSSIVDAHPSMSQIFPHSEMTVEIVQAQATQTQASRPTVPEPLKKFQNFFPYKKQAEPTNLRHKIIQGLVYSLIFLAILKLIRFLYQRCVASLELIKHKDYSLKIQHLDLISSERVFKIAYLGFKSIRIIAYLLIGYLYFTCVFHLFPWTQKIGEGLSRHIIKSLGSILFNFIAYIPNLIVLILIGIASYHISKLIKQVFSEVENGNLHFPGFYSEWAEPTYKLAQFLLVIFSITVAYPYLPGGFESPAFKGIAIFGAILGALGARESVSDIISGIVLIYSRAFLVGDRIAVNDISGIVLEKSLLVTRIRTPKNVIITLPNSTLRNSNIINYSATIRDLNTPLILHVSITLGYDLPWRTVHQVLLKAAYQTPHILKEPAAYILQTNLNDFHVSYELNAYTDQSISMEAIYSDLYQNIQDCCREANIEILSPNYFALRDGNEITIPKA